MAKKTNNTTGTSWEENMDAFRKIKNLAKERDEALWVRVQDNKDRNMSTEEVIKRFLCNDEVRDVLFNEVPPVITLVVTYLKPVDGADDNIFTPKTAKLYFVRNEWKSDAGEMMYGYFRTPEDTKNKIVSFLEQFENVEDMWLQQETYCGTRYIGLKDDNH